MLNFDNNYGIALASVNLGNNDYISYGSYKNDFEISGNNLDENIEYKIAYLVEDQDGEDVDLEKEWEENNNLDEGAVVPVIIP